MTIEQDAKRAARIVYEVREGVRKYRLLGGEADRKFTVLEGLSAYERRTGAPVTMTQIAQKMRIALPNVGRLLRPFEEEGLIVREKQGRTVSVKIAPAGEQLLARQKEQLLRDTVDALGVLSEEERALFLTCCEKVIAKLDEQLRTRKEEVC